jgi:hypothetical protein
MFRSCTTRLTSESVDVVPASMDMALTPISPATWVMPMLAFWTLSARSPSIMLLSPWMATVVTEGSAYSRNAIPYKISKHAHAMHSV